MKRFFSKNKQKTNLKLLVGHAVSAIPWLLYTHTQQIHKLYTILGCKTSTVQHWFAFILKQIVNVTPLFPSCHIKIAITLFARMLNTKLVKHSEGSHLIEKQSNVIQVH